MPGVGSPDLRRQAGTGTGSVRATFTRIRFGVAATSRLGSTTSVVFLVARQRRRIAWVDG